MFVWLIATQPDPTRSTPRLHQVLEACRRWIVSNGYQLVAFSRTDSSLHQQPNAIDTTLRGKVPA